MNFIQLSYFKHVVDEKSFTKAAQRLYVTQSAVSQQVNLLEESLGCQLLYRKARNLRVTPDGEFIYQKAKSILSQFEGLRDELKSRGKKIIGKVKIGSGPIMTKMVLTDVVSNMLSRFPKVSFSLFETYSGNLTKSLLESRVDLGLGVLDEENKQIHSEKLLTGRLVLICSTHNNWSSRQSIPLNELSKINLIRLTDKNPESRNLVNCFNEIEMGVNFQLEAMNTETIVSCVQRNMGMALAPDYLINLLAPKGIAVIELEKKIELGWGVMSDKCRPVSKAALVFIDNLKQLLLLLPQLKNNTDFGD
jgi:LysR family transcriptional regulator, cyn operon transcriptional activator